MLFSQQIEWNKYYLYSPGIICYLTFSDGSNGTGAVKPRSPGYWFYCQERKTFHLPKPQSASFSSASHKSSRRNKLIISALGTKVFYMTLNFWLLQSMAACHCVFNRLVLVSLTDGARSVRHGLTFQFCYMPWLAVGPCPGETGPSSLWG